MRPPRRSKAASYAEAFNLIASGFSVSCWSCGCCDRIERFDLGSVDRYANSGQRLAFFSPQTMRWGAARKTASTSAATMPIFVTMVVSPFEGRKIGPITFQTIPDGHEGKIVLWCGGIVRWSRAIMLWYN
jgi:hypothetical protein